MTFVLSPPPDGVVPRQKKAPKESPARRPFTDGERELIGALQTISVLPGSSKKRFIRDIGQTLKNAPDYGITEKQAAYLVGLAWHFRRQLARRLVPAEKPLS